MRIKFFPFDSVFILFFKEKASLIWKYKDIIIFRADDGEPISTKYRHIAMIVPAYALGKQIRYKTVSANSHGELKENTTVQMFQSLLQLEHLLLIRLVSTESD